MTRSQKLQVEQSELRQKINERLDKPDMSDEERTELDGWTARMQESETELRAAIAADGEDAETREAAHRFGTELRAEDRERLELREKATLSGYLMAAMRGAILKGPEAELQAAAGVDGIPLELWDTRDVLEQRALAEVRAERLRLGLEDRDISGAPGTIGINLDPIRPAVFAPSIAGKLMIDMPRVPSGTFATGTISTSVTADAVGKSSNVPETAAIITVGTATPKRVGANLGLTWEDIAAIGQANFEAALRENVSMVLSDELDDQMLNGDGMNNDLIGIFERLTAASAPDANVETWSRFAAIQASGVEGLWATELADVAMLVNPATYRLGAETFQANEQESSASYLKRTGAPGMGFQTNRRMPDAANNIAPGILCRKGRTGMRTAVCPTWGSIGIDDIYSGSRKGERYYTLAVLAGDVIIVQPGAYAEVAYRVSV